MHSMQKASENKKKLKKYIYLKKDLFNLRKKNIPKVKFDYIITSRVGVLNPFGSGA